MTETKFVYPVGNYSILLLQDNDHSPNLACAALLVLLVLTLTLNSFVLLSILGSPLRSSPHNAVIATVAGVSLVDGLFNLTSSIVFHVSWPELPHFYGKDSVRVWCRSNAALLQITSSVLSFALAVLSYDRLSNVNDKRGGNSPSGERKKFHAKWILLLSGFGSVILALPVCLGVLDTTLFEQRMSCSPARASMQPEGVLIAVVILLAYLTTWFFILRNSFIVARKVLKERRRLIGLELVARQRAAERGSPSRGITHFTSELLGAADGEGLTVYILAGLLIASFMLTVVPNVLAVQVTQFYRTYHVEEEYYVLNGVHLEQIRTDLFDSIFAWARHGYNAFSPGLILLIDHEILKQCKTTFCCCFVGGNTYVKRQSRSVSALVRDWKLQRRKKTVADYRTPVLFATSQGIHLRTVRGDCIEREEPQFLLKFCDLTVDEASEQQTPIQIKPLQQSSEKTFVVKKDIPSSEQRLGETFVKFPNSFDVSKTSRYRSGTIELGLISENCNSLLSLSQRMRNRDS